MAQAPQQNYDVDLNKMAAMLPSMPDEKVAEMVRSPQFGALALIEVSKRERKRTMEEAQKGAPGGNIADAMIAQMMQQKMRDRLMAEEAMGLNNLVAQAEQGNIQFGEPEPEMPTETLAGGGMIAFERGGKVPGPVQYDDGSQGYLVGALVQGAAGLASRFGPAAYRAAQIGPQLPRAAGAADAALKKGASALGIGASRLGKGSFNFLRNNPITSGLSGLASLPFMFGDEEPEGPPVSDTYPETAESKYNAKVADEANKVAELAEAAKGAKNEKEAARGIADLLGGKTTASDILKERRRLEQEAGLGEYGSEVKEKQAKRRAETEEKFGKEKIVQALLGAAEGAGAGGKRIQGGIAGVLAAAASGGGKGALASMREERAALKEIDEAQEKMALAEDLYKRGDIASAQKMAAEAQQQQQESAIKLRQLQIQERALAARAGKGFTLPQTILTELEKQRADLENDFSNEQIDEAEYQRRLNILELRKREVLSLALLSGAQRTERDTEG